MGLINLKTDLKSLKYGHDRPGGGNSGQPYIQTDINRPGANVIGNLDDGLVRGGILGATKASVVDTIRIGKFLTDFAKGPLFIVKQVGLQLSNPRLESKAAVTGIGFIDRIASKLNDVNIGPTRIYNLGINTIAQVPVNAFGIHFNRHGLLPVQDDTNKYLAIVQSNNKGNGVNNRLVKYANKLLPQTQPQPTGALKLLQSVLSLIPGASNFITPQQQMIDQYVGGPGSVYGIGKTFIRRYDYTNNGVNKQQPQEKGKINYAGLLGVSNNYFDYSPVNEKVKTDNPLTQRILRGGIIPGVTDINILPTQSLQPQIAEYNNIDLNNPTSIPTQVNNNAVLYGNSKTYSKLRAQIKKQSTITGSYSGSISTIQNTVNRNTPDYKYYGKRNLVEGYSGSKVEYNNTNLFSRKDADILSVSFRAIDPFNPSINSVDDKGRFLFSAYMKGFKDNFEGTWNDVNYAGRAESFFVYNKFKRTVNFSLQIPCFNKVELFLKHRALGQLASTTAGAYSTGKENGGLLGGVILRVNVGNYLVGEYAILNSLIYDIPDDTAWDIDDDALLAMNINANFSLTIIHKKLPQYSPTDGFFGYLPKPKVPKPTIDGKDSKDADFLISSERVAQFTKNEYK